MQAGGINWGRIDLPFPPSRSVLQVDPETGIPFSVTRYIEGAFRVRRKGTMSEDELRAEKDVDQVVESLKLTPLCRLRDLADKYEARSKWFAEQAKQLATLGDVIDRGLKFGDGDAEKALDDLLDAYEAQQ